ncbi:MAG: alpha/beta hydrolase [Nakamurella sp.]
MRSDVTVTVDHRSGWPVYALSPRSGCARGAVVYVHGGGWVHEIASQHWHLAAQIAAEVGATVLLPIYPLVPFGTSAHVVEGVADLVRGARRDHGATCVAGDSAGGQIALSAAMALRDRDCTALPLTVLISPALDLSMRNPDIDRVLPCDPWLGRHGTEVLIEHWRGDLLVDDPRVSPLAGDFAGLGPITIFTGTRDILNPDTHLMRHKAVAAGVTLGWHEGHGLVHVYPLTPTPEGAAARQVIVDDLRRALTGSAGQDPKGTR